MFISQIKNFDKFSNEADVIVSDGYYEIMCYCHPLGNKKLGALVTDISALFANDIMRIYEGEYLIHKELDYYLYYLHGKVIDKDIPLIGIGDLRIKLDKPLAKDIERDDFVEFKVERLNCLVE